MDLDVFNDARHEARRRIAARLDRGVRTTRRRSPFRQIVARPSQGRRSGTHSAAGEANRRKAPPDALPDTRNRLIPIANVDVCALVSGVIRALFVRLHFVTTNSLRKEERRRRSKSVRDGPSPGKNSNRRIFNTDNKSFNSGCHFLTRDGTRPHLAPETHVPRADAVPYRGTRWRKHAVIQKWRAMRATGRRRSRRTRSGTSSRRRWTACVVSTNGTSTLSDMRSRSGNTGSRPTKTSSTRSSSRPSFTHTSSARKDRTWTETRSSSRARRSC